MFGAVIFSLILGHDIVTTKITWAREISRIVQQRCASCHRAGGSAPFALATYDEARPWARSIAEEVLERRMPPWNPVKGFGQFRHEAGLSQEEIGLIADWVEGGAPRGDPRYLPPAALPAPVARTVAGLRVPVAGQLVFAKPLTARGIAVTRMAEGAAISVWAELPDGSTEPLLEIAHFRSAANQPYEFLTPLALPAGTRLHLEGTATVALISSGALPARQSARSAPGRTAGSAATPGAPRAEERSR